MMLYQKFKAEAITKLKNELGRTNIYSLPRLTKVTVNVGLNEGARNDVIMGQIEQSVTAITGQKPVHTKARQSIAGFKVREGMVVGMRVTLRGQRMYTFVDKLINITIPRMRDFRGINISTIDQQGNMTIGFKEHLSFPEINPDAVDAIHGLQVVLTTTADSKDEGHLLFKALGFPFKK